MLDLFRIIININKLKDQNQQWRYEQLQLKLNKRSKRVQQEYLETYFE